MLRRDVARLVFHDLEEIAVEDHSLGDIGADREPAGRLLEDAAGTGLSSRPGVMIDAS